MLNPLAIESFQREGQTMGARRKRCSAIECKLHIRDQELFCHIHIGMLQAVPRLYKPVAENQEPTSAEAPAVARRLNAGFLAAREYIAKKEGRARVEQAVAQVEEEFDAGIPYWKRRYTDPSEIL
jgi:hypothetical protein